MAKVMKPRPGTERMPNEPQPTLPCQGVLAWTDTKTGHPVPPRSILLRLLWKNGTVVGAYLSAIAEMTIVVVGEPRRVDKKALLGLLSKCWSTPDAAKLHHALTSTAEEYHGFTGTPPPPGAVVTIPQIAAMMRRMCVWESNLKGKIKTALKTLLKPNVPALIGASLDGALLRRSLSEYETAGAIALIDPLSAMVTVGKPVHRTKDQYRKEVSRILMCIRGYDAATISASELVMAPIAEHLARSDPPPIVKDMWARQWPRSDGKFKTDSNRTEHVINIKYPEAEPFLVTSALLVKHEGVAALPAAIWGFHAVCPQWCDAVPAVCSMIETTWLRATVAALISDGLSKDTMRALMRTDAANMTDAQHDLVAQLASRRVVVQPSPSGGMQLRLKRLPLRVIVRPVVSAPTVPSVTSMFFTGLQFPTEVDVLVTHEQPLYWQHLGAFADGGVTTLRVAVPLASVPSLRGPAYLALVGCAGCPMEVDLAGIEGPEWLGVAEPELERVAARWCARGGPATDQIINQLSEACDVDPPGRDTMMSLSVIAGLVTRNTFSKRVRDDVHEAPADEPAKRRRISPEP